MVDLEERQTAYTVLRDLNQAPLAGPFERSIRPRIEALAPSEPHVEVEDLSRADILSVSRDPQVRAIAPIMPTTLIRPLDVPEATAEAPQTAWGITAVGADTSARTGAGVVVAVLDTGIDADHPAFAGVELVQEDFSGSGNGDNQGHGTHCAGTIFGRDVNGTRIGVAQGVSKALIGKGA